MKLPQEDFDTLIRRGIECRGRRDFDPALDAFRRACEMQPRSAGARCELAYTALQAEQLELADESYRAALQIEPDNPGALIGLGVLVRRAGKAEESAALLERAMAVVPSNTAARLELATSLRESGRYQAARPHYEAVLAGEPGNLAALVGLGLVSRQLGEHEASLGWFFEALRLHPTHAGLRTEIVQSHRLLGQLEAALDLARDIVRCDPKSAGAWLLLASLLREAGDPAEALRAVDSAQRIAPGLAGAWLERGLVFRALDQRREALDAFAQAEKAGLARAGLECAAEQWALGDAQAARSTYERIGREAADGFEAPLGLAQMLFDGGDYEAALAAAEALARRHPDRVEALRLQCLSLVHLGHGVAALALAAAPVAQSPRPAARDALHLEVLRTCGDRDGILELLGQPRLAAASGASFALWLEMVLARLTIFDVEGARALLDRPEPARRFERARVAYLKASIADIEWHVPEAIRLYEKAFELNPSDGAAQHHLARLRLLQSDTEAAARHQARSIALGASILALRGESRNVSQSLLGQILNEARIDDALRQRLQELAALGPQERIEPLLELVREQPSQTAPALALLLALRQAGFFSSAADADLPRPPGAAVRALQLCPIPRQIIQFWDETRPPVGIVELMRTWVEGNPGFRYVRYDLATARAYLADRHSPEVRAAFERARHPAQAADIFRLAILLGEGGYYVDADDRCLAPLAGLEAPHARLLTYQEQYASLGNNFLACVPGEPVVALALQLGVEAVNRGDADSIWLATGPGLLSRAFAQVLARAGADWVHELRARRVLDRASLTAHLWPHAILPYKQTHLGWLVSPTSRARENPAKT